MNTRGEQFRRRIRGKTQVKDLGKKKVKQRHPKNSGHRQAEDFRLDPISNVSQSKCFRDIFSCLGKEGDSFIYIYRYKTKIYKLYMKLKPSIYIIYLPL